MTLSSEPVCISVDFQWTGSTPAGFQEAVRADTIIRSITCGYNHSLWVVYFGCDSMCMLRYNWIRTKHFLFRADTIISQHTHRFTTKIYNSQTTSYRSTLFLRNRLRLGAGKERDRWIHRRMNTQTYEYTDVWIRRRMNTQTYGYTDVWIHRRMNTQTYEYVHIYRVAKTHRML